MEPSYYAIIPANVRYDKRLKANEKLLFGEITALANTTGYCYATNKYFADLYDVTGTSISLWVKNLIDCGYIKSHIQYKEGTKEILKRYLSLVTYPIQEILNTPMQENLIVNSTRSNNTSLIKEEQSLPLFQSDELPSIPHQILNYLSEKKGSNFKLIAGNLKFINARLKEGFVQADFEKVIDASIIKWGNDKKMKAYIRPKTLFAGENFNGYLEEADDVISTGAADTDTGSDNFVYAPAQTAKLKE